MFRKLLQPFRNIEQQFNLGNDPPQNQLLRYQALAGPRSIRLLRVWTDFAKSRINGRFAQASLDENPNFQAISYCWGSSDLVDKVWFDDHQYLGITRSAAEVIRLLIDTKYAGHFWIDALCINQSDLEEKSKQVHLMGDVYSSAQLVVAWLGEPADDSDRAMQFIATLHNEIKQFNLHELDPAHGMGYVEQFPSFKQLNSPDWVAFQNLFRRPWFSRLWVIQEMVLSRRAILACGKETAGWDELTIVVEILLTKGLREYLLYIPPVGLANAEFPGGLGGLIAMSGISAHRIAGKALPLQELLLFGRHFAATNPRDLIFGLLGVAPEVDDGTMPPDYQSSAEEIFVRWTRYLMTRDGRATLLHGAGLGQIRLLKNIPSWVPDLTARSEDVDPNATIFGENAGSFGFSAAGTSKFILQSHAPRNFITVQGIIIDTTANLARPRPLIRHHEDIKLERPDQLTKQKWQHETLELVTALSPYPTAEPIQDVYWRTLVANIIQDRANPPLGFFDNFVTYLEHESLYISCENRNEVWKEASAKISSADLEKHRQFDGSILHVGNRVLFTTANGYAGLGPQGLKKGDRICLILGATTPFIIRENEMAEKVGDEDIVHGKEIFVLVGECYIHGLMGGEGMTMGEVQDIVLC
jgi:hypothetical protein